MLTGDFNINLLKFRENNMVNNFLESVLSCGYVPKITLPTRLTQQNGTLIDNCYIKISDEFSVGASGIILNQISDHLPYFVCLDYLQLGKIKNKYLKISPYFPDSVRCLINDLKEPDTAQKLKNVVSSDSNESYKNLINIVKPLLDKHFPTRQVRYNKYKHRKCRWMTRGIMKSIAYKDKLYIKLKSTSPTADDLNVIQSNFKTYNRILRQTIRIAKKDYYHNCFLKFKSDIKQTWSTINDIICKSKKSDFPEYFEINGSKIFDYKNIANEFNKYFTHIGPNLAESIQPPIDKSFRDFLSNPLSNDFIFKNISTNEISKAIDSLKPKTSSGNDNISNKLLKAVKNELLDPLMLIVNQSFSTGIFPDLLKIAKVTPLYKKGKNSLLENYRPISLLPSVSKVFERIMHNQIYEYFENSKLLYRSQYGFRRGHSTELAALELVDKILKEMDQGKIPINVYMDLSKAFDTLDHYILLEKLKYYGFHDKSLDLLKSYLCNRKQYVEYNNIKSDLMNITCGVPQGSILGPLLFIVYMNDLPSAVNFIELIIYADDTTLFANLLHSNISLNVTNCLNQIYLWMILESVYLFFRAIKNIKVPNVVGTVLLKEQFKYLISFYSV